MINGGLTPSIQGHCIECSHTEIHQCETRDDCSVINIYIYIEIYIYIFLISGSMCATGAAGFQGSLLLTTAIVLMYTPMIPYV